MDKTPHSQKRYLVRHTNQAIKLLSLKPTALVLCTFQLLPDMIVQSNNLYYTLNYSKYKQLKRYIWDE